MKFPAFLKYLNFHARLIVRDLIIPQVAFSVLAVVSRLTKLSTHCLHFKAHSAKSLFQIFHIILFYNKYDYLVLAFQLINNLFLGYWLVPVCCLDLLCQSERCLRVTPEQLGLRQSAQLRGEQRQRFSGGSRWDKPLEAPSAWGQTVLLRRLHPSRFSDRINHCICAGQHSSSIPSVVPVSIVTLLM